MGKNSPKKSPKKPPTAGGKSPTKSPKTPDKQAVAGSSTASGSSRGQGNRRPRQPDIAAESDIHRSMATMRLLQEMDDSPEKGAVRSPQETLRRMGNADHDCGSEKPRKLNPQGHPGNPEDKRCFTIPPVLNIKIKYYKSLKELLDCLETK